MVDEDALETALRISGERTYSAVVNRAISEFIRRAEARGILELQGSGVWKGDLAEMRRDAKARRSRS